MPEGAVYVGRPTKWGNPYRLATKNGAPTHQADISKAYASEILSQYEELVLTSDLKDELHELKGKDLACWCPLDSPCHADILLKYANREVKA
jgi:hypothetical protein